MASQPLDEQAAVETLIENVVEQHHRLAHLVLHGVVHHAEVVFRVEHVEVFNHLLVGDVALTERRSLVEDAQRVAHAAVGLLGNDGQRLVLILDALLLGHVLQVGHGVLHRHALEVVNLAAAQDGGQDLVLLGGGEDEDDVCRRLLQRLEEGVEGGRREHVHLVDDKHLVASQLRRYARLLHECLDMLHGVVRRGVKLEDVQRALLVERLARLTLVTGLAIGRRILAIDGFGKDAGTGGLAYAARPAKQVGMRQLARLHGVLQRGGQTALSHHRVERHRPVLARRYYIFFHWLINSFTLLTSHSPNTSSVVRRLTGPIFSSTFMSSCFSSPRMI